MERVSNTIDVDIDTQLTAGESIPLLPRKRHRMKETEEVNQGLIEVLDLKYCDGLLQLIAQRNSNLGRVMQPSQQMLYEIRFIRNIRQCLNLIRQDPAQDEELKERIETIYNIKSQNLKSEIWNGIFGSKEVAANFSRSETPIPTGGEVGFTATYAVFLQFQRLSKLDPEHHDKDPLEFLDDIETSYKTLNTNRYGSRFLKSIALLTETMERTAHAINTRLDQKPFCHPGHQSQKRTILSNVFRKFYSEKFQPYLSRVHRNGEEWLSIQANIFGMLEPTPEMNRYFTQVLSMTNEHGMWQQYIRARDNHTSAWQRILRQCNLMPGGQNEKGRQEKAPE